MSLPNPNIEFVPLDKLTASQLNQLVANIVALANGTGLENKSVNGDKLANNSIKPEHLHQTAKRLLISYKQGSASHTYANNGDSVLFDTKVYDKTEGLIVSNNGVGSFRANYNGFMKLSTTVWTANGAGNPWIKVLRRTTNSTVIQEAGAIGNTNNTYYTLNVSEAIFPVSAGDVIWVAIFSSNGNKPSTNNDSGGNHTMITIEALL